MIKLRPEANAREMSGNLTKRPGQEISLQKHTLGGHEIAAEETLLYLWVLICYLGCYAVLSSQLNFADSVVFFFSLDFTWCHQLGS